MSRLHRSLKHAGFVRLSACRTSTTWHIALMMPQSTIGRDGIPYVPYFPLGGFNPLQSSILSKVAARLNATPMQVALAWLLHRAPNILLIPGTSSVAHLWENLASAELSLPDDAITALNGIGDLVREATTQSANRAG
jgi:diketogulonate reductase-like aldo/keto reductase